jgi:hypothetical protein
MILEVTDIGDTGEASAAAFFGFMGVAVSLSFASKYP